MENQNKNITCTYMAKGNNIFENLYIVNKC
jgi:hypothetical protein